MALWALWYASLALGSISIGTMLLLVVRRVLDDRRSRHTAMLRARTTATLFEYLDGSADQHRVLVAAGGQPAPVDELVFELRELVRGGDAGRLVALARDLGGFERARTGLTDRNPKARVRAVRFMAMYGEEAAQTLGYCLKDRIGAVRIVAALELTRMGHAPGLEALASALDVGGADRQEELRQVFRPAVAADPREAIGLLEDEFSSEALRLLLLDGLAQAGVLDALATIASMVGARSPAVRSEALRSLAILAHPSAAPAVIGALSDESWWVRAQAANAVRRIEISDAIAPLATLLSDEHWWVRLRAAEALCALGENGQKRLAVAATGRDEAARIAQLVLAEKGLDG